MTSLSTSEDIARAENQEEGSHQMLNQTAPTMWDFLASKTVRSKCLLFKPPSLWNFVVAAQTKTELQITQFERAICFRPSDQ